MSFEKAMKEREKKNAVNKLIPPNVKEEQEEEREEKKEETPMEAIKTPVEAKEAEEKSEERTGLEYIKKEIYEDEDDRDYKIQKNMTLSTSNVKWIQKEAKKAGKNHSQFVDMLITMIRERW